MEQHRRAGIQIIAPHAEDVASGIISPLCVDALLLKELHEPLSRCQQPGLLLATTKEQEPEPLLRLRRIGQQVLPRGLGLDIRCGWRRPQAAKSSAVRENVVEQLQMGKSDRDAL